MPAENPPRPFHLFLSFASEDRAYRDALDKQLTVLQRLRLIDDWHRQEIAPGDDWQKVMAERLDQADIILLFITPDYLTSNYCYHVQMPHAMKKHEAGEARVIPIYLRPIALYDPHLDLPFTKLRRLPKNGDLAVSELKNKNRDSALAEIVAGIKEAIDDFTAKSSDQVLSSPRDPASHPWHVPYQHNPFFMGRDDILHSLHETLASERENGIETLALSGLGGCGKTQIALEYAYRYRDEYHAILWIQGDSAEDLRAGFIGLATLLNLPEQKDADQENVIAALKRYLSQTSRWLIIIDNLETFEILADLLPTQGRGAILATTRRQATGVYATLHRVEMLTPANGALFLLRRAKLLAPDAALDTLPSSTVESAYTISHLVAGLPLALDQAGAYMEETTASPAEYIKRYKKYAAQILKQRRKFPSGHPASVAATFALCIEQAGQRDPASLEILSLCAFLHPDGIPLELFSADVSDLGPTLQALLSNELAFDHALETLIDLSLLHRNSDTGTLSIHRLVQVVLRDKMKADAQRLWTERAIKAVYRVFPASEMRYWPQCQQYLPHALLAADLIQQGHLSFPEAAQLLYLAASYLYDLASYAEARKLCEQALAIVEQVHSEEHSETASLLHCLGNIYESQGLATDALDVYERALAIAERVWGSEQADMARLLNDVGEHFQIAGQFPLAEDYYQRALAIRQKIFGPEHPDTASSLNNMAGIYEAQDRYEQAAALYEQALHIRLRLRGPHHSDTAESFSNVARFYRVIGKYVQAEPLYEQAIVAYEQALGPQHPRVATCYNNFAVLCIVLGRYTQAEQLLTQALDIRSQLFGLQHPSTAGSWNYLARVYYKQGRYEQAQTLYQQALTVCEHASGRDHPSTTSILVNMGELYLAQGNDQQAEALLSEALTTITAKQGPRSSTAAPVLNLLGEVYLARAHYERAGQMLTEALAIRQERLGKTHPETAMSLKSLGDLSLARDEDAQAAEWYQQALELVLDPLGPSHPDVIVLVERLTSLLQKMGRAEEAQALAKRVHTQPSP
ncbi:MAG: FxSxx-COOH system tetratricopeptide repeat protein [Chloroflexota bacterium]|nr:FxSxx-COOH system tetratricopeptide repeat protein [Chloroflexota bacterium]